MPTKKLKISDNIIFEVFNLANFMKERQIMGVEDRLERKKSVKGQEKFREHFNLGGKKRNEVK